MKGRRMTKLVLIDCSATGNVHAPGDATGEPADDFRRDLDRLEIELLRAEFHRFDDEPGGPSDTSYGPDAA